MRKLVFAGVIGAGFALAGASAQAGYVYVGDWEVNSGPYWGDEPSAYTGQEAAALLFGGVAADYAISTNGSNPAEINFDAWYSVLGYYGPNNGGVEFAQNYVSPDSDQCCGLYYSGGGFHLGDSTEAASAYVWDNAGNGNVNYAFRITGVPEPTSVVLLFTGLAGLGVALRGRPQTS